MMDQEELNDFIEREERNAREALDESNTVAAAILVLAKTVATVGNWITQAIHEQP